MAPLAGTRIEPGSLSDFLGVSLFHFSGSSLFQLLHHPWRQVLGARSRCPCNGSRAPWGPPDPQDLNLTGEELRLKYLGPQQAGLFMPICVTYLLVFAVGAVGTR